MTLRSKQRQNSHRARNRTFPSPESDQHGTEYSANYTAFPGDPRQPQIRHRDHRDIFAFHAPKTEESGHNSDYSIAASVHNPSTSSFAGPHREIDTSKFRRLEQRCDVNPLSPKHRRSDAFDGNSSYRSNFVNFFPASASQGSVLVSRNETFCVQPPQEQRPPEVLPFDIATRDPATEVPVASEYRDHFIDFGKVPERRTAKPNAGQKGERRERLRDGWDGARGK
jgi:hypothetical protein